MVLHIPSAHEQGQICIYAFLSKMYLGKKFLRFYNYTRVTKKSGINRFYFHIDFATNCFTVKKNPASASIPHQFRVQVDSS